MLKPLSAFVALGALAATVALAESQVSPPTAAQAQIQPAPPPVDMNPAIRLVPPESHQSAIW